MVIIILGAVIGFILCIVWLLKEDSYYFSLFSSVFLSLAYALVGGAVGFAIVIGLSLSLPSHTVPNTPIELYNLGNGGLEGRFFLGTGSVDDDYYQYKIIMPDDPEKLIRDQEIGIYRCATLEDNPETPYLQTYHEKYDQDWMNLFAFADFKSTHLPVFHIPKGSINRSYNIK